MLSSGHEHSFICSLSFNVIAIFKKQQKSALPQRPALFSSGISQLAMFDYMRLAIIVI